MSYFEHIITLATPSQADFPSPFTGNQMTPRFWANVRSDGRDISAWDGTTKLKRELVSIDVANETMELYVKTPLNATTITLRYGDLTASETNDADTWDANYVMVHHMNDNPNTSTIQDSTSNNYDGTKKGAATPNETSGAFAGDKAQETANDGDYITHTATLLADLASECTVEAIVKPLGPGPATDEGIIGNKFRTSMYIASGSYIIRFGIRGNVGANVVNCGTSTQNVWGYFAGWFTGNTVYAQMDTGSISSTANTNAALFGISTTRLIGPDIAIAGATGSGPNCDLAECRLSNTARSEAWRVATYNSLLNNAAFATGADGDVVWAPALRQPVTRTQYCVEVRGPNGNQLWHMKDIDSGTIETEVNQPAVVKFSCPVTPAIAKTLSSLVRPNEIWVWKDGEHIFSGKFSIVAKEHSTVKKVDIDCIDYMQSLKAEYVYHYDADATPTVHVTAWLAEQVSTMPVFLGTIEPVISFDITIDQDYIYDVLMKGKDIVGGYLQVDGDRKLNWYDSIGENTGKQLRYDKNATSIIKTEDWLNFGNKLYIYGDTFDLTGTSLGTLYILDQDSIDTYDVSVRKYYISDSFADADTLFLYAQRKLKDTSQPRISYTVDLINLEDHGWLNEELNLGDICTVIDDEIEVNAEVMIVRLVRDIVTGQNVEVELSTVRGNILDMVNQRYY